MTDKVREAAVKLVLSRGWEVFPVRRKKKMSYKRAATSNGRPWGATRDPEEVDRDFTKYSRAGIGVPTGRANSFFAWDADSTEGHGVDGLESTRRLEERWGPLPATLTSLTPSGGFHKLFRMPEGKRVRNSTSKVGPGIDIRGDGGMIVVAPSVKDGTEYRWVDETAEIADAPQWLVDLVCEDEREPAVSNPFAQGSNLRPVDDAELAAAVAVIPNNTAGNWEAWNRVALAIWRATDGSDFGLELFDEWSKKCPEDYDAADTVSRWREITSSPPDRIGVGTILYLADEAEPGWRKVQAAREAMRDEMAEVADQQIVGDSEGDLDDLDNSEELKGKIKLSDFWACMENHSYIYAPTGGMWPPASVNSRFGKVPIVDARGEHILSEDGERQAVAAAQWLDTHRPVEQVLWDPGGDRIIRNKHLLEGGWVAKRGATCYNTYRPPLRMSFGDPTRATLWLEHVYKLYPTVAEHILDCLAFKVQFPGVKINHALVFLGEQGIGKDTLLEPIKHAVGPWNFADISPHDILSSFSGYLQNVVIRVNEARDLGDVNRYQFHERTKIMIAAPPDVLRVNEKFVRERAVLNCCFLIFTTNRPDSIYLPEDDRRHLVAHSALTKADYPDGYWTRLWGSYDQGGFAHIAAYLRERDVSRFDPKAAPPKTEAFWQIVEYSRSSEMPEMASALNNIGNPDATTINAIANACQNTPLSSFYDWLTDRKNRKSHGRLMTEAGYVSHRNPDTQSGLWVIRGGERAVIYVKASLTAQERGRAASELARGSSVAPEADPPSSPIPFRRR